jgi:multidrug efflux pump subunit AcrA (membrane-fusion protein)
MPLAACKPRETTSPQIKTIQEAVFATGQVKQDDEYQIASTADGVIVERYVKTGDSVRAGQALLRVKSEIVQSQLADAAALYQDALQKAQPSSPPLAQLQAQIAQAELQVRQDEANYQRYQTLRSSNSVSQLDLERAKLQYEASETNLKVLRQSYKDLQSSLQLGVSRSQAQLKSQQASLDDYRITAQQDGVVIAFDKQLGELVRRGELIGLIGSGPFILQLYVAEEDIAKLRVGQQAAVRLNTYPDEVFAATLSRILPGFDMAEQSYLVEARLTNGPAHLFHGTQLQANVEIGMREGVLVVPSAYVEKGQYVRLKDGRQVAIEIGQKNREWTEVRSGLQASDIIVRPQN